MSPFDTVLAIFRNQLVYCLYKFTSSGILQCFSVIFAQQSIVILSSCQIVKIVSGLSKLANIKLINIYIY